MTETLPIFMPPTPFRCEGYWSARREKDNPYLPIVSSKPWPGKDSWIAKALFVQQQIPVETFRGLALSRLTNEILGNQEYHDDDMCWPEQYVEHYIRDHDVRPTEKFYSYILRRYDTLVEKSK